MSNSANPQLVYNKDVDSTPNSKYDNSHIIPYFSVHNDKIVVHPKSDKIRKTQKTNAKSLENLKKPKFQGSISKIQATNIKRILTAWISAVETENESNKNTGKRRVHVPVFITLTMSVMQSNNDKWMKRHLLDNFVKWLKASHGVEHYFWRAEKQKNGNIHFHLIIDKYIAYADILEQWNKIQDRHLGLDMFKAKYGHKNPNSVDVRGTECSKNFINYVVKYCVKNEDGIKVQGRVYGMSDSLRKLRVYKGVMHSHLIDVINKAEYNHQVSVYEMEYVTIIKFEKSFFGSDLSNQLKFESCSYYRKMYKSLYEEGVTMDKKPQKKVIRQVFKQQSFFNDIKEEQTHFKYKGEH